MKPVEFKHQNVVFAKDQPEYIPLPALKIAGPEGDVVSCWKMTFLERLKVIFTGKVWLSLRSFNNPLTPSFLAVNRKEIYSHPDDKVSLCIMILGRLFKILVIIIGTVAGGSIMMPTAGVYYIFTGKDVFSQYMSKLWDFSEIFNTEENELSA